MTNAAKWQTIATFCMDYHSGRWSKGYKLLNWSWRRAERYSKCIIPLGWDCLDKEQKKLYNELELKYSGKL